MRSASTLLPGPLLRRRRAVAGGRGLNTRRVGERFESRATLHYRLRGYRVLGANVWAGGHELDLIVRRGRRLVFCEVKGKATTAYGHPLEMVTPEKRRRVRLAAETWLARHPECRTLDCRFEVVAIEGRRLERVSVEL
ncbi:MAG: YraN family protein [Gaiellaceae bacterium MAG52_C11]|nr:YraN family protein [Candidatus Gaiellasilicea maunaloa]